MATRARSAPTQELRSAVERALGARELEFYPLQSLWGGYGQLYRAETTSGVTCIVKHIAPPEGRGLDRDVGHQRKLRSYRVEQDFYRSFAPGLTSGNVVVPKLLQASRHPNFLILEDLDARGYPRRRSQLNDDQLTACLVWLARFHATFLGREPGELWKRGTYWHLGTRGAELTRMKDGPLRDAAGALDRKLTDAQHRTLVHGDAKPDNFCFPEPERLDELGVAGVDFQYVGVGVGVQDVAYLASAYLPARASPARDQELLAVYFAALRAALGGREEWTTERLDDLEREWRDLYVIAYADFYRFLAGWAPGAYDDEPRSLALIGEALARVRK